MYFGMPVIGLGGDRDPQLRQIRQAVAIERPVDRPLAAELSRIHGFRISAEPDGRREFDTGWRKGVDSPYEDVWKLSETFPGRQYRMWDRIQTDPYLRGHARHAWDGFKGPPMPPPLARQGHRPQRRGGAAHPRARRRRHLHPAALGAAAAGQRGDSGFRRARGWDMLLVGASAKGIHFDDLPQAQTPGDPRMVAPQPQMRDGVHRRLCAPAGRADSAPEAARRCAAVACGTDCSVANVPS